MSSQTVVLSGNAAGLLRELDKVIAKEREAERQLHETAGAGDELGDSFGRTERKSAAALKSLIGELGRTGKAGREVGSAVRKSLRDSAKPGFDSVETLIGKIRDLDPAAAEAATAAADRIKTEMAEADRQSELTHLLASIDETTAEGKAAAEAIRREMQSAGSDAAADVGQIVDKIGMINPAIAEAADRIKTEMAEAESAADFDRLLTSLRQSGEEGKRTADLIASEMKASTESAAGDADSIVDKLAQIDPTVRQAAETIRFEMAEADRQSELTELIASLKQAGDEGIRAAAIIEAEIQAASASAAGDVGSIVDEISDIDPAIRAAADRIKTEMADADRQSKVSDLLESLRASGDAGAHAASKIESDMKAAAASASGDMETILDKLREIDPTVAGSADAIESELAEAAKFSEGKFEETLVTLRSMGPTGRKVAQELKRDLVAAGKLSERSIDDVVDSLKRIDPAAAAAAQKLYRNIDNAAKKGGKSMEQFSTRAVSQLASVAGGYIGIQAAIQKIIELNQKVIQTNREAFESVNANKSGDQKLLQVSSSSEDFQALQDRADRLSADNGIDRDQTRSLVFSARSEGFEDTLDFIASNQQVIDVGSQARVAGQIPALFSDEGLTGAQAINGTLAGANASRLDFSEIGRALPTASEGGAIAGAEASETIAALSVLSSRFKSADTAADRIKAFATKVGLDEGGDDRESLQGQGIIEAVESLAALSSEQQKDFLGDSQEVNTAFTFLLAELDAIKQQQTVIDTAIDATGTDASPTAIRRQAAADDDRLKAAKEADKARIALEISREERRAEQEAKRQANLDRALRAAEDSGVSETRIAAGELAADFASGFGRNGANDSAQIVEAIAGNKVSDLIRDLALGTETGDDASAALLLAAKELRETQVDDGKDAVVSKSAASEIIFAATGESLDPARITPQIQQALTNVIAQQANESGGFERTLSVSTAIGFGKDLPFLRPAYNAAAQDGVDAAQSITDNVSQNDLIKQLIAETKTQNLLLRESLEANNKTAANTAPEVRGPAHIQPAPERIQAPPRRGDVQRAGRPRQ